MGSGSFLRKGALAEDRARGRQAWVTPYSPSRFGWLQNASWQSQQLTLRKAVLCCLVVWDQFWLLVFNMWGFFPFCETQICSLLAVLRTFSEMYFGERVFCGVPPLRARPSQLKAHTLQFWGIFFSYFFDSFFSSFSRVPLIWLLHLMNLPYYFSYLWSFFFF